MGNLRNLKTDERLLKALNDSSKHEQSESERHEQRVSFVFGSLDSGSNVTRERVRELLAQDGLCV